MSRVSISAAQKPKPKETFKFLRRDEGRLSYSTSLAESPSKGGDSTPRIHNERKDSRALREAIAHDMRNAKGSDPFGEVVIAVPKKAPPPNKEAAAADTGKGSTPASKRAPPRQQSKSRPQWVDPDIPARREAEAPSRSEPRRAPPTDEFSGGYGNDREASLPNTPGTATGAAGAYEPYTNRSAGTGNGRRGLDYAPEEDYDRHDMAGPPRRTASAPRRYADPQYDDYDRNFFRRGPASGPAGGAAYDMPPLIGRSREEESLMLQLEQEVRAAQEERARYAYAKQQLDREKQRFDNFRFTAQQQLDDERAELEAVRMQGQRAAQKDVKALEERYRSVSSLLSTEREANRKLMQENDALRAQLEETTATMREQQKTHKAEVNRLRREIDSLTTRNSDLLALARDQQIQQLDTASVTSASVRSQPRGGSLASAPREGSQSTRPARQPSHAERPAVAAAAEGLCEHTDDESVHVDAESDTRSNGERQAPVVMDFTPRAKVDPAKERRAREMEERMRREEEEMQRRRQQRERTAAAREEAAEEERERVRAASVPKRKEAPPTPTEDVAKARKAAGHPPTTPRLPAGTAKTPATTAKKPAAASAGNGGASTSKKTAPASRFRIPSREELVGDAEGMPEEEYPNDDIASQTAIGDNPNKREVLYRSGKREIHYANGTRKVVLPSGHTVLHFTNGDIKCTYPSGKSTYWYDAAQTTHTQNPDGVQIFEFNATGQTERHLVDGTKEILYPDGIFKVVKADGSDETFFPEDE